jgi:hypothetical protein
MSKIILEHDGIKAQVEYDGVVDIPDMFDYLIIPSILAVGFQKESIDSYLNNEE